MSVVKVYLMRCDHCGFTDETSGPTAAAARRQAWTWDWTHPRANQRSQMRVDICPTCSAEAVG